jgi:hypothetical protein
MTKKITLASIASQIERLDTRLAKNDGRFDKLEGMMEKGFAAAKDDIADLKMELKGDIARVQEQVNSIEAELKYGRYETRLGKLEEKVFGEARP